MDYDAEIRDFESNRISPIAYANYAVEDSMTEIAEYSDNDLYDPFKGLIYFNFALHLHFAKNLQKTIFNI